MALGKKKKEAVSEPESAEVVDDSLAPQDEVEAAEEAADVLSDPAEDEAVEEEEAAEVLSDPVGIPHGGSEEAAAHRAADSVPAIDVAGGHKAPDHRHGDPSGEAVGAGGVVIHSPDVLADVHKSQGV